MELQPGHEAEVWKDFSAGGPGYVGMVGDGKVFLVKTSRHHATTQAASSELKNLYANWCRENA